MSIGDLYNFRCRNFRHDSNGIHLLSDSLVRTTPTDIFTPIATDIYMSQETYDITAPIDTAINLAADLYGIVAEASQLAGEVDLNFKLKCTDGERYILKITNPDITLEEIEYQEALLRHLSYRQLSFAIPSAVPSTNQNLSEAIHTTDGSTRYVRVLTWVDGLVLDSANPRTPELFTSWGRTCGQLTKALADFDHAIAHRPYRWDPARTLDSRPLAQYFTSAEQREIGEYFWNLFDTFAKPMLSALPMQINYNDAHEQNLMIAAQQPLQVTGVIDFGDAIYTQRICELAIAAAYAGMNQADPLQSICRLIEGYTEVVDLKDAELEVLYSMIAARLLITVASSAQAKRQHPDNKYLLISEKPAWQLLHQLRSTHPRYAHYAFRSAAGKEPVPNAASIRELLIEQRDSMHTIMYTEDCNISPIDLSVGSKVLGNNSNFDSKVAFEKRISRWMDDTDTDIAFGGYLEPRPVYTTDAYRTYGNQGNRWRTIHLGLDLWATTGTQIYSPLPAKVHRLANNNADRDYGPTVILEHELPDGGTFYTLYGHLSVHSLELFEVGDRLPAGACIGTIGAIHENGGWPPHLHLQILLDDLGSTGDFPGVAYPEEVDVYSSLCPDPQLIFHVGEQAQQPAAAGILATRQQHLGRSLSLSYSEPLHMARGYMQYLYDNNGRRYLDTVNNVAHVGHEHPVVVRAAQEQIAVLNTNTRYLHHNITAYAEELLKTFPPELSVVHFVNSGSEANELALRMMETMTNQRDVIAVDVGYHGNTGATIDISSYKFDSPGGTGRPTGTHIVPMPDTYRGAHNEEQEAGAKYANYIKEKIEELHTQGRGVKGFICESILSCGGQIPLPAGYLKEAYRHVRAAGGLCVADEVQVGFGRVGSHFWGFQLQGVVPDIVTLGKPIGNGHPLAAVVTTAAVADAFANGMEYFNTFGGNPVSCAIGRSVLQVIKDEKLQQRALEIGTYLTACLTELQGQHPIIGDIRGTGLFQGMELVSDSTLLTPAADQCSYLANRMRQRGYLMSTDGPHHNVIKIKPPMCITRQDITDLAAELDLILREDGCKA